MGTIHFLVPDNRVVKDQPELMAAFTSGIDGHIFPTKVSTGAGFIEFSKTTADSCKLNLAWQVPGYGRPIVRTASLSEKYNDYILVVELARGKLSELKDQKASWENSGMNIPAEYFELERAAFQSFRQAACQQDDVQAATESAEASLVSSFQASEILLKSYIAQRQAFRKQKSNVAAVSLGCFLSGTDTVQDWYPLFNEHLTTLGVPLNWKLIEQNEGQCQWEQVDPLIEWCLANRMLIYSNSLLDLSLDGLPPWLHYYQHDPMHMQDLICDYVEMVTSRYVGKIRNWDVIARANSGGAPGFSEENRLTLAARVIDIARQADDENQLFLRVDQPWGAYQGRGGHRLSPFQFVDALLRSGIGLTGVNLEIAQGYQMVGAGFRELMDISRLIDQWSTLGVPLYVTLAIPSSTQPDPLASNRIKVVPEQWRFDWSPQTQSEWIDECLPLLMSKQAVVGLFWSHWSDLQPHTYPHAGLIGQDASLKPAFDRLIKRISP